MRAINRQVEEGGIHFLETPGGSAIRLRQFADEVTQAVSGRRGIKNKLVFIWA